MHLGSPDAETTADFTNDHVREAIHSAGTISNGPIEPTTISRAAPAPPTDSAEANIEVQHRWTVDTLRSEKDEVRI